MTLEVLECDSPYKRTRLLSKRIIPAGWWIHDIKHRNPQWIKICDIRWWQLWRLSRINSCWPYRLKHKGRVVWTARAVSRF